VWSILYNHIHHIILNCLCWSIDWLAIKQAIWRISIIDLRSFQNRKANLMWTFFLTLTLTSETLKNNHSTRLYSISFLFLVEEGQGVRIFCLVKLRNGLNRLKHKTLISPTHPPNRLTLCMYVSTSDMFTVHDPDILLYLDLWGVSGKVFSYHSFFIAYNTFYIWLKLVFMLAQAIKRKSTFQD